MPVAHLFDAWQLLAALLRQCSPRSQQLAVGSIRARRSHCSLLLRLLPLLHLLLLSGLQWLYCCLHTPSTGLLLLLLLGL